MKYARSIAAIVVCVLLALGGATQAAPAIDVTPTTIDRLDNTSIEVTASGLTGGEVLLRLWVDADGDGTLGAADYPVWADRIPDNGTEWAPGMLADEEPASGTVTVNPRIFGPFAFPRTAGNFLWHAEDPSDGSAATVAFAVTQTPGTRTLSGRVFDDGVAPVAGALVVLQTAAEGCGDPTLTAAADADGYYTIEITDEPRCGRYVARATRPGAIATLADSALLDLLSDPLANVDLTLRSGVGNAAATIVFADGDRATEGVPGITLFAETDSGALAVAFSDVDGGFAFGASGNAWTVRLGDPAMLSLQGAVSTADLTATLGADVALPAANAFVRGRLMDDGATPLSGAPVAGHIATACAGDCWTATAITAPDGRYVLGLHGPAAPATASYAVAPAASLADLLASRLVVDLSAGDSTAGVNLDHVAATYAIAGRVVDAQGVGIAGLCVRSNGTTTARTARAFTDCDGNFALPALDGSWDVRLAPGALAATVLRIENTVQDRYVPSAADADTLEFVAGPPPEAPFVRTLSPLAGPAGTHVVLEGGNFGPNPTVTFDGVEAEIVAVRSDLGRLVVATPAGLVPGTATIVVTSAGSASNEHCFEVLPGAFASTCSIGGVVTRNTGTITVQGALVVAFDPVTEEIERADVTDARGVYDLDLDDGGANYGLLIFSSQGTPRVTGRYPSLPCPLTQNHNLRTGRLLTGAVRDPAGDPIADVAVTMTGVLASGITMTRADGSYALRGEQGDNVTFTFAAPTGSRWINDQSLALSIPSGQTDLPDVVLREGSLLTGRVVDPVESALIATVAAERRLDGTPSGAVLTNSCDGSFALALDDGEHRLRLDADDGAGADVEWIDVDGDGTAPFAFTLSPPGALAFDEFLPRLNDETSMAGRIGQTVMLGVENLLSSDVDVLFSAGHGDWVAGKETVADNGRGYVFTRVPAGAVSGDMKLRSGALESPPSPFTVLDGSFVQGGFVLGGQTFIDIEPVEGVLALLFLVDPDALDCEPAGQLHDADVTDVTGRYDLLHPGGDVLVLLLPPREGARLVDDPPLTLAAASRLFPNQFGNRQFTAFLVNGTPLTMRVVTGSPPQPVGNARVSARDRTPDFVMTGPSGLATVYLTPEFPGPAQVDVTVQPPLGSRLMLRDLQTTAPNAIGDVALAPGVIVASQIRDADQFPLVEATASGIAGNERTFAATVRRDGAWRGPVAADGFSVILQSGRLDLADATVASDTTPARDRIVVPGVSLAPGGILAGSVRDAATGQPVDGAAVTAFGDDSGVRGVATGFARTCSNGEFRAKAAEGTHFIVAEPLDSATHFTAWYTGGDTDFCPFDAQSVVVSAGATSDGLDMAIDAQSTIRGTVSVFELPAVDVAVTATAGRLGSCEASSLTGRDGDYELIVPAGTGYRVESAAPLEVGGPSQCYDGLVGCPSFTPVDTSPGAVTDGIDFLFLAGPPEVGNALPLMLDKSGDDLVFTFEQLPPEDGVDGYNVYGGAFGAFDVAIESNCFLDPAELEDDGKGNLIYVLSPDPASEWFLVSASNSVAESSLGMGRSLTNACGAMPLQFVNRD